MKYWFAASEDLFEAVAEGEASLAAFTALVQDLFKSDDWRPGMRYLFDYSDVDSSPLTAEDVRRIADVCIGYRDHFGSAKLAVVVKREVEFGLARMWGFHVDGRWDVAAEIFRTRSDACRWLEIAHKDRPDPMVPR